MLKEDAASIRQNPSPLQKSEVPLCRRRRNRRRSYASAVTELNTFLCSVVKEYDTPKGQPPKPAVLTDDIIPNVKALITLKTAFVKTGIDYVPKAPITRPVITDTDEPSTETSNIDNPDQLIKPEVDLINHTSITKADQMNNYQQLHLQYHIMSRLSSRCTRTASNSQQLYSTNHLQTTTNHIKLQIEIVKQLLLQQMLKPVHLQQRWRISKTMVALNKDLMIMRT
ncbi:MAG: hypothetical protein EZS28_006802 [Streblomastix strix]|uniref:Uncharacterized protein n=1 Tax=Streblomastix strix TaxID=222440 RepID=A0A5J4WRG2_9EUKA|nr:MAG: hypothetical protein EZS28_006802 [Streblomastix strix]